MDMNTQLQKRNLKLLTLAYSYKKLTQNGSKTLNLRAKTRKLSEENRENLQDIGFGSDFLAMTQKAQATKKIIGLHQN